MRGHSVHVLSHVFARIKLLALLKGIPLDVDDLNDISICLSDRARLMATHWHST